MQPLCYKAAIGALRGGAQDTTDAEKERSSAIFAGLGADGIALLVAMLIMSLAIHEVAHAWVALRCGDSTARDLGRITLNPIPHIDPFMTVLLPLLLIASGSGFLFGGAKPVPVVPSRLRNPYSDMMFVALAGPVSNFLIALLLGVLVTLALGMGWQTPDMKLINATQWTIYVNLLLAAFNMLPVPPLDGSRVMAFLLPKGLREPYVMLERYGMLLLVFVILSGVGGPLIISAMQALYMPVEGLGGWVASLLGVPAPNLLPGNLQL